MRVAFILMEQFTLAPVTGFVESLRFAADQSFRSQQLYCRWDWISVDDGAINASCGLSINPNKKFDLTSLKSDYDYVVIAGSYCQIWCMAFRPLSQLIAFPLARHL